MRGSSWVQIFFSSGEAFFCFFRKWKGDIIKPVVSSLSVYHALVHLQLTTDYHESVGSAVLEMGTFAACSMVGSVGGEGGRLYVAHRGGYGSGVSLGALAASGASICWTACC